MPFNIKTYHANLDRIQKEHHCSRKEAQRIYKDNKKDFKPVKAKQSSGQLRPGTLTPESIVELANSRKEDIGLQIESLEHKLRELKDDQAMWEHIASSLDEDKPRNMAVQAG